MGKVYKLSFERDFKDEVAASVKTAFKIDGAKRVSHYLDIVDGYAREIANVRGVPLGNLERCTKALGIDNGEYYYAVVAPYRIAGRYYPPDDELKIFSFSVLSVDDPSNHFESDVFDVDNNLYRNVLRYWRYYAYDGTTRISTMCEQTGLSNKTIFNALHLNLNPRCSTIQRLLYVYGLRLIILKSPQKLQAIHIKMKY